MKFKKGLSAVLVCSLLASNTFTVFADEVAVSPDNTNVESAEGITDDADEADVEIEADEDITDDIDEEAPKVEYEPSFKVINSGDVPAVEDTEVADEDAEVVDATAVETGSTLSAMETETNFIEYKGVGKNSDGKDVEFQLTIKYNYTYGGETCGQILTVSKTEACEMVIPDVVSYTVDGVENQIAVRSIKDGAFQNCAATSIVLPETMKEIGSDAFRSCPNLKSVVLKSSTSNYFVTGYDDDGNFTPGDEYLKSNKYYLFDTKIADGAFQECPVLESVEIAGYQTIGASVFANCPALKDVSLDFSNMYTVNSSTSKPTTTARTGSMGNYCFQNCTALESITLPDKLKSVGTEGFFDGCSALKSVYIGLDVSSGLSVKTFTGCSALEAIHVAGENASPYSNNAVIETVDENGEKISVDNRWNTTYRSIDGALYSGVSKATTVVGDDGEKLKNDDGDDLKVIQVTTLIAYPANKRDAVYTAPDTLTAISDSVFANHKYIGTVVIDTTPTYTSKGDEVTATEKTVAIGKNAFAGSEQLTSVSVNNICTIGNNAFDGCSSLSEFVHDKAESTIQSTIGDYAFRGCAFTTLNPKYWKSVGASAFVSNESLETLVIGSTVGTIGNNAFEGCTALTSADMYDMAKLIDDNNVTLGTGIFKGCTSLESVILPENLVTLGSDTFNGCTSLTDVQFGENVGIIGSSAFEGCTSLATITPSRFLVAINANAFKDCTSLTQIELTRSVKSVQDKAFDGCTSLTTIAAPAGTYAETYASDNKLDIVYTENNIVDKDFLLYGWVTLGKDESLAADYDTEYVKCVDNVYKVYCVTGYRGGFEKITFKYADTPNIAANFISNPLTTGASMQSYLQAVDLRGMEVIGNSAFKSCSALTTAVFDESLVKIDANAFASCAKLCDSKLWKMSDRRIGESGTVEISLDEVNVFEVPSSCTSIGQGAFSSCKAMQAVDIPNGTVGVSAFTGCTALTSVTTGDGVTSIGKSAFSGCTALAEVELADSISAIGASAFSKCTSLTRVDLPESLETVDESTFANCTSLSRVTFNILLETIKSNAFLNCTALETVTLNRNIFLESNAFKGCTGIKTVVIPDAANIVSTRDPFPSSKDCTILCTDTSQATAYTSAKGYTAQTVEFVEGINYAIIKVSVDIPDDIKVTKSDGTAVNNGDYVVVDDVLNIEVTGGDSDAVAKVYVNGELVGDNTSAEYVVKEHDYALTFAAAYVGDVNGDKNTTAADAALVLKYLAGSGELTDTQLGIADVNEDELVNMLDVVEIINLTKK
jgi:hypothetical protein